MEDKDDNRHFLLKHAGTIFLAIAAITAVVGYFENRKLVLLNKELADLQIRKLKGGAPPIAEGGAPASAASAKTA